MTFSDLMNGDWVIRKGIPSEPMQVVDFNVMKGLVFLDFQGCGIVEEIDNIAPIPLTPEILKRIGFSLEKFSGDYMKGNWWESPGFLIREDMHESIGKNNFYWEYVHQLQHAFKLCGLTQPIKL